MINNILRNIVEKMSVVVLGTCPFIAHTSVAFIESLSAGVTEVPVTQNENTKPPVEALERITKRSKDCVDCGRHWLKSQREITRN